MSEPKVTLKDILNSVKARPTTPELEFALVEFLDLTDSEQKALIFREICHLSSQLNYLASRLKL